MTLEKRWDTGFEIINEVGMHMLHGAMWKLKTDDLETGWSEVHRQRARLREMG
jgi:hypothetical protein